MSFFDLSIPFIQTPGATAPDTRRRRDSRLQTVARAMELGYTAVAYDRPFRGILSDADRCQILPFSPQSFFESIVCTSPAAFSASVGLHRDLLGVPRASPFRQYTRLTVSVDSVAAASNLNGGNRLLRSYDLVAARPLNQMGFDQACSASEVDIISLDFSRRLPFRLKLGMVQAAIKRGVHFEISYSHIIAGDHARRQILSEAKRLGDWTRGKNLIISGSAASLNEVRGPCDVANLSTILLGLTMERAKAAISRNCRSLVANALRKKDCYFKEAIRIERILPEENIDSQGDWFKEWSDWDPISSGENDLPSLDDMTKLFCAASKHSKSQNTVDFTSTINGMVPNASIFSCTYKKELDSSNSKQLDDVDHAFAENTAAIVAKSLANTTNEETKPRSDEHGMVIDVFENPSRTEMSITDGLSSKGSGSTDVHGVGMINRSSMGHEDAEIRDQVGDVADFAQTLRNANNSLDCSFVSPRDEISMANNDSIIAAEEDYSEKMDMKEKISSSGNVQLNAYPDKMEGHERLLITIEAGSSEYPNKTGGMEQLTVPLETSISEDINQENQLYSSTSIILSDSSAKLEIVAEENILSRTNNSKGFVSRTKGKKKRVSTAEITEVDVFSKDLSTSIKENQCSSLENDSSLEGQNIQLPVKVGGVTNRHLHKSGNQRLRRRSQYRGYLLTARSLCKALVFKKTTRLRRMRKFL